MKKTKYAKQWEQVQEHIDTLRESTERVHMTEYDIQQIRTELRRLGHEKVNTCPFEDLIRRVNYLETTNNDLTNRIVRLEDEVQDLNKRSETN